MVLVKGDILVQVLSLAFLSVNFCNMVTGKGVHNQQVSVPSEEEQIKACYNFTEGNKAKQEFYSPNYPNTYPNNSDCTRVIKAAYGHVVRVDFLDQFHLEDSKTCEYDSLEIRNGPHSYSESMGRFCGNRFPDTITTTDRHMWLRFTSDDSIEYYGFRAVYRYASLGKLDRPEPKECTTYLGGSAGIISSDDIQQDTMDYAKNYSVPIDCTWIIRVKPEQKVNLNFPKYRLGVPNNCELNYLEIIEQGEKINEQKQLVRFCGTSTESQKSRTNVLHIHYFLKNGDDASKNHFQILYTAFREGDSCDPLTEFNCEDGTCIDKSLKCNGWHNCNYMYDEDQCRATPSTGTLLLTSEHMIIILIVFFALVLGMCTSISISCYSKVKERRQREQEVKLRRSKEASLEVGLDHSVSSLDRNLEAALAAQAAEMCARRKVQHSSNVRRGPQDTPDDESNGCYVPEVDLSVFRHYPNGGPDSYHQHHMPYCEHSRRRDSESPPLPPPPPPPLCPHGNPRTFLPSCGDDVPSQTPRFRAEATIEMNASRARSYESTRSAPDVIVHR